MRQEVEDATIPMRRGDWMQTFTGTAFWPIDPQLEDINIVDIAHSLSLQCRFAGHTREFYSVAQHSVIVAQIVPRRDALWGLLHDASEAYLVDLPRPVKRATDLGIEYQRIEKRLMHFITRKFGLPETEPYSIKDADNIVLMTEARDLLGRSPLPWGNLAEPMEQRINPWTPEKAERAFLNMACILGIEK